MAGSTSIQVLWPVFAISRTKILRLHTSTLTQPYVLRWAAFQPAHPVVLKRALFICCVVAPTASVPFVSMSGKVPPCFGLDHLLVALGVAAFALSVLFGMLSPPALHALARRRPRASDADANASLCQADIVGREFMPAATVRFLGRYRDCRKRRHGKSCGPLVVTLRLVESAAATVCR
jgi:hypothetical protein